MTGHIIRPGLAPSPSLAPSPTLAPAVDEYSGGPITPHQIAIACGVSGAYVDVTEYVEFGQGITYTYGRPDQFQDVAPGTFTFTLNNLDGRFTPGNPGSPLATRLVEGMGVCWLLGTRLVHTTILSVEIPPNEDQWDQIVIHCDDMLGNAGRYSLTNLADQLTAYSGLYLQWRLDESSGAMGSAETNDSPLGAFNITRSNPASTASTVTYGVKQADGLPGTAITLTAGPGETIFYGTQHGSKTVVTNFPYTKVTSSTPSTSEPNLGWWGFWVYPGSTVTFSFVPHWAAYAAGYSDSVQVIVTPTGVALKGGTNAPVQYLYTGAEITAPHFVTVNSIAYWQGVGSYWSHALLLYIDAQIKVSTLMQSANPALAHSIAPPPSMLADGSAMQPVEVSLQVTNPGSAPLSGTVQRVTHTEVGVMLEQNALYNSLDQRRAVIDTIDQTISSATYAPAGPLSDAVIGFPDLSNRSALDVYNDIARSEVGHLFCLTTGSLTDPVEQIQVRARDRPETPKASFDVSDEGVGVPTFVRDATNVIEAIDVQGPTQTLTVSDPTAANITTRLLKSGQQDTILMVDQAQLRMWGMDRINRTKNIGIRAETFTVDAMTTPTDRSADLLGLVPGDRVRVTNLPTARLGFSSWDGWLIGCAETHNQESHQFQFTLAPTLPNVFKLDSSPLMNHWDITLTADVTATQTSLPVQSATGLTFVTPCVATIGAAGEQIQITAATSTSLTVVRGFNGTTAIAHVAAAVIEVSPATQLAY